MLNTSGFCLGSIRDFYFTLSCNFTVNLTVEKKCEVSDIISKSNRERVR